MADVEEYFGLTGKAAQEAAQYCDSYDPDYDDDDDEIDENNEQEDWQDWNDPYGVPAELAYELIEKINAIELDEHEMQSLELIATVLGHNNRLSPELLATLVKCARVCETDFASFFKEVLDNWENMKEDEANAEARESNASDVEKAAAKTPYPFGITEEDIPF